MNITWLSNATFERIIRVAYKDTNEPYDLEGKTVKGSLCSKTVSVADFVFTVPEPGKIIWRLEVDTLETLLINTIYNFDIILVDGNDSIVLVPPSTFRISKGYTSVE